MMILLRKYLYQKKKDFFKNLIPVYSNLVYLKIINTLLLSKRVFNNCFLVIDLTCWCEKQTNDDAQHQYR